jgi:hypothetical protein
MLRSNHPAALYSQIPYPPHLYGMMQGAPPGLGIPGLHERLKMEEEHHRARLREEEKAREREREEREREMREREAREREQREKEQREREQREKEQREREQREKEAREREMREKEAAREREAREREARERERMMQSHLMHQRNPLNLLGFLPPPMGMAGLRGPPSIHPALQSLSHHAHPSLLGLGLPPSQIPASSSLNLSYHQQPPQGSSPITTSAGSIPTSLPLAHSLIPSSVTNSLAGLSPHGLHNLSMFGGPPPAHVYNNSLLSAPPSVSTPSSSNLSSFNSPAMHQLPTNTVASSGPGSGPGSTGQQSLNLSKHPLSQNVAPPVLPIQLTTNAGPNSQTGPKDSGKSSNNGIPVISGSTTNSTNQPGTNNSDEPNSNSKAKSPPSSQAIAKTPSPKKMEVDDPGKAFNSDKLVGDEKPIVEERSDEKKEPNLNSENEKQPEIKDEDVKEENSMDAKKELDSKPATPNSNPTQTQPGNDTNDCKDNDNENSNGESKVTTNDSNCNKNESNNENVKATEKTAPNSNSELNNRTKGKGARNVTNEKQKTTAKVENSKSNKSEGKR